MNSWNVFATGSTGNGTGVLNNADGLGGRVAVEFQVEAVGATPTITWQVEGSLDGTNWGPVDLLQMDATVAGSNAAITTTTVGKVQRFIDGGTLRFYSNLRVRTTLNTNVTYSARFLTPSAAGFS